MTAYRVFPPEHFRPWECDTEGLEFVLERLKFHGVTKEQCKIKEVDRLYFDFGGMAKIDEEVIDVEINGTKYSATLTQFPWAIEALRKASLNENNPNFIRIGMFMGWGFCTTAKTRDELVWKMEQLWPEVSIKCQKAEQDLIDAMNKAGGISRRPPQPEILP